MRHVPHHDTAETAELLRVADNCFQLRAVCVSAARSRSSGNAQEEFHVLIWARVLGPIVPDVKIERILGGRARLKIGDTAPIVIKLNHDKVESNGIQSWAIGSVGKHTLRRRSQVKLLTTRGIHKTPQLGTESGQVISGGLEVEVEPIDDSRAKRTVDALARRYGSKHVPDQLGSILRLTDAGPSSLGISSASEGQDYRFTVGELALLYIGLQLRTTENVMIIWKRSAVVSSIGKIGDWRADAIHESKWDDINIGVGTIIAEALLGERAGTLIERVLAYSSVRGLAVPIGVAKFGVKEEAHPSRRQCSCQMLA